MLKLSRKIGDLLFLLAGLASIYMSFTWLVYYSGIEWSSESFAGSALVSLKDLTQRWGPLFIPVTALIFIIRMLQRNITADIKDSLHREIIPELESRLTDGLSRQIEKLLEQNALVTARSVSRALQTGIRIDPESIKTAYRFERELSLHKL